MKESRSYSTIHINKDKREKAFRQLQINEMDKGNYLTLSEVCAMAGITQPTYNNVLRRGYMSLLTYSKLKSKDLIDIGAIRKKK